MNKIMEVKDICQDSSFLWEAENGKVAAGSTKEAFLICHTLYHNNNYKYKNLKQKYQNVKFYDF